MRVEGGEGGRVESGEGVEAGKGYRKKQVFEQFYAIWYRESCIARFMKELSGHRRSQEQ